ncbi:MAG: DUF3617 family protein [Pseudolabrys sp.]|jgi:hypothetical protein
MICSLWLIAPPAYALDVQPGLWQDTVTGEVNGKPIPRKVTTNCVTPAQSKDVVKQAQAGLRKSMKELAGQCSKLAIGQDGNVITFEMKCGGGKEGSVEATTVITVHSPRHTTNVAKSTIDFVGQKRVSAVTTDSRWVAAACKK